MAPPVSPLPPIRPGLVSSWASTAVVSIWPNALAWSTLDIPPVPCAASLIVPPEPPETGPGVFATAEVCESEGTPVDRPAAPAPVAMPVGFAPPGS